MTVPLDHGPSAHRTLFESLPEPAWVYDAETLAFLDVNDAAIEEYGHSREEFRRLTLRDIRPPEDLPALEISVGGNRPGLLRSGVFRHIKRGGRVAPVFITSHELTYEGRPARLVVARDMTEQLDAQRALEESERRYRDLFEQASEIIVTLDLAGRIRSMNRAAETSTGYSRAEATGLDIFSLMPEESARRSREMMQSKLRGEADRTTYELELLRRDGELLMLEISSRLLVRDGKPAEIQVIARDITERVRLEAELMQAQKMEGIGRLAGGIAHDFNNLLTAIIGQADLARQALGEGQAPHLELEQIVESGQRAAALTRQLLAFARKDVSRPRVVQLNDLVLEMDKLLRRLIGEDVTLVTVAAERLSRVRVDPGQLQQVLMNLAVNARDAMPRGGRLTIETANVELDEQYARQRAGVVPGPHVMLAVSDTGGGMTPEVLAHAFEPFFTTKGPGKGTGLGLAICYGVVRQNGGHIAVESEVGRGTTFRIFLPHATGAAGSAAEASETPRAAPRGTETVLIAEDEPRVRALAVRTLRRAGFTVLEAESGPDALAAERRHPGAIHLLVTDQVMPGMAGAELARRVRERRPEAKVLFVSGYAENGLDDESARAAGAAYLPKPFSAAEFVRKVREVLDGGAR